MPASMAVELCWHFLGYTSEHKDRGGIAVQPDISQIAALIGESARSKMLTALMGGRALTATELALEADIMPQTASSHLAKLLSAELIVVRKQGRHKYFQLRDAQVAEVIENLLNLAATTTLRVSTGPGDPVLRQARICYDHLAGEYGVALYDALVQQGFILDRGEETILTPAGKNWFESVGVDFSTFLKRRPVCKSCLDWSERRNHLAGSLGQWLLDDVLNRGWASRLPDSRAIIFSAAGLKAFTAHYRVTLLASVA